jgi:hypothetical protein
MNSGKSNPLPKAPQPTRCLGEAASIDDNCLAAWLARHVGGLVIWMINCYIEISLAEMLCAEKTHIAAWSHAAAAGRHGLTKS